MRGLDYYTRTVFEIVDVSGALDRKLRAIAAHRSQVGDDPTFGAGAGFEAVYGTEWYVRHGPPGPIEDLIDEW